MWRLSITSASCIAVAFLTAVSMLMRTAVGLPAAEDRRVLCVMSDGAISIHYVGFALGPCDQADLENTGGWSLAVEARPGVDWRAAWPRYTSLPNARGNLAVLNISIPFALPAMLGLFGLAIWKRRQRARPRPADFVVQTSRSQFVL